MIWAVTVFLCVFTACAALVGVVWLNGITEAERTKTRADRDVKVRELRGMSEKRAKEVAEKLDRIERDQRDHGTSIGVLQSKSNWGGKR